MLLWNQGERGSKGLSSSPVLQTLETSLHEKKSILHSVQEHIFIHKNIVKYTLNQVNFKDLASTEELQRATEEERFLR